MNEVSNENFESLYPALKRGINEARFIAIDAEFSGINQDESLSHSLFDGLGERYKILKRNIDRFEIIQFGVTTFRRSEDDTFKAETYSFRLFRKRLPLREFISKDFSLQLEAKDFLDSHGFDFGKLMSQGISSLDEAGERFLRDRVENGTLMNDLLLQYNEEDDYKHCRDKVSEWLSREPESTSLQLPVVNPIMRYVMQKKLRSDIENVWTTSGYRTIDVVRVTKETRDRLEKEGNDCLEEELLDSYVGFSKVFKLLSSCKKPVIGHNILLDLMFIHKQFYRPLPVSYKQFKKNVHELFPSIYDTKYMSYEFKRLFTRDKVYWECNSLKCIYEYFTSGAQLTFNCPWVQLDKNLSDTKSYHNAGWDSYFTGCIFIKMAHVFCVKKYGSGIEMKPVTNAELMSAVKHLENCVNVARAKETHMIFGGDDPKSTRHDWLHVKSKSPLDPQQLYDKLHTFGNVDVQCIDKGRFLVAVPSHKSARCILEHFKDGGDLQVTRYNPVWHARPTTICLWSGTILYVGGIAWMIKRIFLT